MMRLETVRVVTDWLKDPTNGVNAKLVGVPRDAGDDLPAPVAGVHDETRDNFVATKQSPPKLPCLYVTMDMPVKVAGAQLTDTYRDNAGSVWVTVRYLGESDNVAKATTDGDYILRAVSRSVLQLMEQEADAVRTRNSVCVFNLKSYTYVPSRETVGDAQVSGALILEFDKVRDAAPLTGG